MAAKGQKFKKYTYQEKLKIIKDSDEIGIKLTAKKYGITCGTIATFRRNKNKPFVPQGRPIKNIDWKCVIQISKYVLHKYGNYTGFSNAQKATIAKDLIEKGTTKSLALHVLELKRTTFLYQLKQAKRDILDEEDFKKVKEAFVTNKSQFGYRRTTEALRKMGIFFNHKKVARLMNKYDLRANYVRKEKYKQSIKTGNRIYPDLIQRRFSQVTEPLTVLYTDVTYIIHKDKRAYQSTIIDGATKEIIDYKISYKNDNELVMANLKEAIEKIKKIKKDPNGIIIHSDHGYQYTSYEFKQICEADNLIISQGKAYTCADNVVIESFHSLLKKGTIHNNKYANLDEYINDVVDWNCWYNSWKDSKFKLSVKNW